MGVTLSQVGSGLSATIISRFFADRKHRVADASSMRRGTNLSQSLLLTVREHMLSKRSQVTHVQGAHIVESLWFIANGA